MGSDADVAEIAKSVLEWEILHPQKGYEEIRDRVVIGALSARMWCAGVDFNRDLGPFGEVVFRMIDGRNLMWADGYHSPHDPECPWVLEKFRMRVDEAKRKKGWKELDKLFADDGTTAIAASDASQPPLQSSGMPALQVSGKPEYFTGVRLWERNVKDTKKRERDGSYRELEPGDRYMVCATGCGWRSDTQDQLGDQLDDGELPELDPGKCPQCGGDAMRTDAVAVEDEMLMYPDGRLTIFAPLCGALLHTGPWPYKLRTVPYLVFRAYDHPVDPMGMSDTSLNWSMQICANMTLRLGVEHMALAKPYIALPEGVKDYMGEPFDFSPHQGLGIYYPQTQMQASAISLIQAAGLPPAWNTLHQAIQGVFRANMGTSDLGLTPQASKDIPVGTVRALVETGEIPVDHHIEKLRRSESPFFGATFDIIRATYSTERMVRFQGEDGGWQVMAIRGADIPNFDVVVTASPELARVDAEEIQGWQTFAATPPEHREFIARRLNIPISEIRKLEEKEKEMAEQARQQREEDLAFEAKRAAVLGAANPQPQKNGVANGRPPTNRVAGANTNGRTLA